MGFFSNLINKFTSKFTSKASEKLATKAVDKIFKDEKSKSAEQQVEVTTQTEAAQPQAQNQEVKVETVEVPKLDATQIAMMNQGVAQSMAQANEIMKYLILDDNMEVIGVKDDAPDYLKIAYKKGQLSNKD